MKPEENKNIRQKELKEITGLSSSTIWRLEQQGLFPKRRRISKRAIAWSALDVQQWLEGKFQQPSEGESKNA